MNKKIIGLCGMLLLAGTASVAIADYEPYVAPAAPKETPLMVIRFKQSAVVFKQPLYDTVTKALQIKPNVQFEIVSVAKISDSRSTQKEYKDVAAEDASKVVAVFHETKVPADQFTVRTVTEPVKANEVRIYAH